MPEYAYRCDGCGKKFSRVMGMKEHERARVACPKCSSRKVRQTITGFNAKTSKKS